MPRIHQSELRSGRTRIITSSATKEEREVWARIYNRELTRYRKEKSSFFTRLVEKFKKGP